MMDLKQAETILQELMQEHGEARHSYANTSKLFNKEKNALSEEDKAIRAKEVTELGNVLNEAKKALQLHAQMVRTLHNEKNAATAATFQGKAFVTNVSMSKVKKALRGIAVATAMVSFSNGVTRHLMLNKMGQWVGHPPVKLNSVLTYVRSVAIGVKFAGRDEVDAVVGSSSQESVIDFDYTQYLIGDKASPLRQRSQMFPLEVKAA
jgi:hypothetical protein